MGLLNFLFKAALKPKPKKHKATKARKVVSFNNPAGSKVRRAIRRGNFGVSTKRGSAARYYEEKRREEWLRSKGYPIITLSTAGGF